MASLAREGNGSAERRMRRDRAAEMRQYVGEKEDALWKQNGILVDERKKDSWMGDHRSLKELSLPERVKNREIFWPMRLLSQMTCMRVDCADLSEPISFASERQYQYQCTK